MERFGAFIFSSRYAGQSDGAVLGRAVAAARTAEASGFDEVWCTEHHFISYGVIPSAATFVDFFAAHVLASHPVGSPEVCADRIVESLRTSGCSRVLMQVEATGNLLDTVTNVERLGREVLPAVRERLAPLASAG